MVPGLIFVLATVVAGAFTVLLALAAVQQHRSGADRKRLRRDGVEVPGTVVDNEVRRNRGGRAGFAPVVRFTTITGDEVTGTAIDDRADTLAVGQSLAVAYDAEQPQRFTILSEARQPGAAFATTLAIGMALITVGTGFFALRLINESRTIPFDLPVVDVPGVSIHR